MADEKNIKYNVAVHKNLPLAAGETVSQFTQKLRKKGSDFLMQQLNIAKDKGGSYMVEVMSNVAIFEVYKRETGGDGYKFYAMKFTRDKVGEFALSDLTEVERITSFRAKSAAIQKSLVAESVRDEAWCRKSLFAGVV